ncbi:MAG: hypothetical protein ACREPG_06590, partial [Candidatus Binatia bacterium]
FIRQMISLRGYRANLLRHSFGFMRRYGARLNRFQMAMALGNAALLCADTAVTAPASLLRRGQPRTHLTTTECIDDVYRPAFPVADKFAHYFTPTRITDDRGALTEAVASDLLAASPSRAMAI